MCGADCLLAIIAIIFPPLPVWVKRGLCSADSVINIALCILGFIPGLLHSWYIISATPDPTYEQVVDEEGGRTTTYIVVQGQGQGNNRSGYQRQKNAQPTYGTVNSTVDSQFPGGRTGFVQPPQASGSSGPPPTYQDAVGDHKVQTK